MAREISIIIRARNAMAAGLASAEKQLQAFGASAMKIGKWVAAGFLAAGTAVVGFAVKALSSYSVQERAIQQLSSAIRAFGEDAEKIVPSLLDMASAIQDETGAADEATIATMARLKLLGVLTPKLGDAAKAVIALKSVGMEEAAASKAVAMAMNGQYDMLNRYVPALRTATSEAEKAQIVNDLISRGYQQQRDLLETVSGSWAALKGRIGDVWEEIGRVIEKSSGLQRVLELAGGAVKQFGQSVADWVDSTEFQKIQASISGIVKAISKGGTDRSTAMSDISTLLILAFRAAAESSVNVLIKAAPTIGKVLGAAAAALFSSVTSQFASFEEGKKAGAQVSMDILSGKIKLPEKQYQFDNLVMAQVRRNRQEKLFAEYLGDSTSALNGQSSAVDALSAYVDSLGDKYANFGKEQMTALEAAQDFERRMNTPLNEAQKWKTVTEFGARGSNQKQAESVYANLNPFLDENNALQAAKNAEEIATEEAKKALENRDRLKQMFLSKDFRREEKERLKQEDKEKRRMERALEAGKKGLKGADITRAQAAQKAIEDAKAAADKEALAKMEVMDREAALKESMDAVKMATEATAANTEKMATSQEELNENLVG